MSYYKDQISKINTNGEFPAKIKIFDSEFKSNDTNHLDLNAESAQVLVDWLTQNYLMPDKKGLTISDEELEDYFQYILDSTINGQKQQAKDLIAELNTNQRKQAVSFFKRECQPDAELLDMLTYWLID